MSEDDLRRTVRRFSESREGEDLPLACRLGRFDWRRREHRQQRQAGQDERRHRRSRPPSDGSRRKLDERRRGEREDYERRKPVGLDFGHVVEQQEERRSGQKAAERSARPAARAAKLHQPGGQQPSSTREG